MFIRESDPMRAATVGWLVSTIEAKEGKTLEIKHLSRNSNDDDNNSKPLLKYTFPQTPIIESIGKRASSASAILQMS